MLHVVNAKDLIDPVSEMMYQFHQSIETDQYPQVHDFYELSLVVKGRINMTTDHMTHNISRGTLILLRPGEVHSREAVGECVYINIAFPGKLISDMFTYLNKPELEQAILDARAPFIVKLSSSETTLLQTKLEHLNLIPVDRPDEVYMQLRMLMLDVVMHHILPQTEQKTQVGCPNWLQVLTKKLEDPEYFDCSLSELAEMSGRTREHLCRTFRKYLGIAPNEYINAKRLNYAANLLLHSDMKAVDIAFASGFRSVSRFYHAFSEEYKMSPLDYRKSGSEF